LHNPVLRTSQTHYSKFYGRIPQSNHASTFAIELGNGCKEQMTKKPNTSTPCEKQTARKTISLSYSWFYWMVLNQQFIP